jgi:SAM-dependent methyltransferase
MAMTQLRAVWHKVHHRYATVRLFGRDARLVPPLSLMYDGLADYEEFRKNGAEFLRYYIELCDLAPDESVLDIGCGIGRKTLPLVGYLNERGRYLGLDVAPQGVNWCREKYAAFPNFTFQRIDVRNAHYEPSGTHSASEYTLPLPDKHFDVVVVNSVFTHMLPAEVENYVGEMWRVLRDGGRCLVSWFLLNEESRTLIAAGASSQDLRHDVGPAKARSQIDPESAIGYEESFVRDLYRRAGLSIRAIHYGSWCGRARYLSYQDLVVGVKTS